MVMVMMKEKLEKFSKNLNMVISVMNMSDTGRKRDLM